MKLSLATAFSIALLGACGTPELGGEEVALTVEECQAFEENGRVSICHATGSETNPYVHVRVSDQGCINGHADHEGDYIDLGDTNCDGQGCRAAGSCETGADCCSGVCQDTSGPVERTSGDLQCLPCGSLAYCDSYQNWQDVCNFDCPSR